MVTKLVFRIKQDTKNEVIHLSVFFKISIKQIKFWNSVYYIPIFYVDCTHNLCFNFNTNWMVCTVLHSWQATHITHTRKCLLPAGNIYINDKLSSSHLILYHTTRFIIWVKYVPTTLMQYWLKLKYWPMC